MLFLAATFGVTAALVAYVNGRWLHVPVRPEVETIAGSVAIGVAYFIGTVVLLLALMAGQSWRQRRATRARGSRRNRT